MLPEITHDLPHEREKLSKLVDEAQLFIELTKNPAIVLLKTELDEFEERMKHKWAQLPDDELRTMRESKLRHYAVMDLIKRKILLGQTAAKRLAAPDAKQN